MVCKKYEASFTVETALIVPSVFIGILMIIYLCFYTHDKCVIEYAISSAVEECVNNLCASNNDGNTSYEEMEIMIRKRVDEVIDKGVIGKWNNQMQVLNDKDYIEVVAQGQMISSQGLIGNFLSGKIFKLNVSYKSLYLNECEWIKSR